MKKLVLIILIAISLVGCNKVEEITEIDIQYVQAIRNIETDGYNMFNLTALDGNYVIEKYSIKGEFIDSYTIDISIRDINYIKIYYNESSFGVYYSLYDENIIYINVLDNDLSISNSISIDYNESVINTMDNLLYITEDNIYLANDFEIVKYIIDDNNANEDKRASIDFEVNELVFAEDLFLVLETVDNEFSIGENVYNTTNNQILLKLSEDLDYIDNVSLDDSLDINGLTINDDIYVYGKTDTKPFINVYNTSCDFVSSIELDLIIEGFIYGVKGIQLTNNEIHAVLEGLNSYVNIYNVNMVDQSISEIFSKQFSFTNPNIGNILEISDNYVFVDDGDKLFIINK